MQSSGGWRPSTARNLLLEKLKQRMVHGPHAPGSASRQRLGDSHQAAPGEVRPRSLTWASAMACLTKGRCMRMLLPEQKRALGAHHAGELVPVAEAPVLPRVAVPCNDVAALVLAPPGYQVHLHCQRQARPVSVRLRHPACSGVPQHCSQQALHSQYNINSRMLLTIPAALCFSQYTGFSCPS